MPKIRPAGIRQASLTWLRTIWPNAACGAVSGSSVLASLTAENGVLGSWVFGGWTWAFGRGNDPTEELWKIAGLAGMSRATFDKAIGDTALRDWIVQQQKADTEQWKIDSTPSFVINNQKYAGEMSYDAFRKLIPA